MTKWFLGLVAVLASSAHAAPSARVIADMIESGYYFEVADGKLRLRAQSAPYNQIDTSVFEAKDKTHRISLKQEDAEGTPIWRLTETEVPLGSDLVMAGSSTFYSTGPRSVTKCFGNLKGGKLDGKMSCATGARRMCSGVKDFFKSSNLANAKLISEMNEYSSRLGGSSSEIAVMCMGYSQLMAKVNFAAATAQPFADAYRGVAEGDTNAVEGSLNALNGWNLKSAVKNISPSALFNKASSDGKSLAELADRSDALKKSGADMLATAALIEICNQTTFATDVSANAAENPKAKATR